MRILEEAKELRSIWSGFWSARVLLTANNYGIFEHLQFLKTADEIAKVLRTDKRATEILLDALTGIGLLKKTASKYGNSAIANRFLVSSSPYYQGDIIRHADVLWENWSGLDEVIRTGRPNHKAHNHDAFIRGMHNLSVLKVRNVVRAISLKGVKKVLDLGGGPGTYAIEMAKKGVSVTLFDRPETVIIAREMLRKSEIKNIGFIQGDFLFDDIGKGYDLIFISHVLHSCSEDESIHVLKKSKKALNLNGRIMIQEFYLRENRAFPTQSALFSINMLINTEGGRCYSPSEIRGWLSGAGLKNIKEKVLYDSVLVSGENVL